MRHEDFERLAWESIDGAIPPEDRERLQEYINDNPDARAEFDELVGLSDLLSRAEEVEPPAELRPRIERAVSATSPRWRRPPVTTDLWRPRLLYLAAGLLVGVVVARLLLPGPAVDRDRVTGFMHATPDRLAAGALLLDLGSDSGALALWREGSRLNAELGWQRAGEVEVELVAENGDLWIQSAGHDAGTASALVVDQGRVALRAAGPGRHVFELGGGAVEGAFQITVKSEGELVAERRLEAKETGDQP